MKVISEEQIQKILNELIGLNIPVKSYIGFQKLFEGLQKVETEETEKDKKG